MTRVVPFIISVVAITSPWCCMAGVLAKVPSSAPCSVAKRPAQVQRRTSCCLAEGPANLKSTKQSQSPSTNTLLIKQTISQLGSHTRDLNGDLRTLAYDVHSSVEFLVSELHTIPRKVYYEQAKTAQSRHVIACLRALRYLTGLTYSATTNSKLSDDDRQFLDFDKQMHDANPSHQLHFFGVWMSRNADFVAPLDVQRSIIRKWQAWLKGPGRDFSRAPISSPEETMDNWYWFG